MATSDKAPRLTGEAFHRLKSDHEQFLEIYEKPTQIYRFLKARHSLKPLFLHRNLSYMRMHRNASRQKRKRVRKLHVDELIRHTRDIKPDLATEIKSDNHLKISFSGLENGIDFTELLDKGSGPTSKPTNQSKASKSRDSQLVEIEILLYRFGQPSAEALLNGHKNSFRCTCSSLGKRVIHCDGSINQNSRNSKRNDLSLTIPESSLTWKGIQAPGGTQMLVFRASHYNETVSGSSLPARRGRRKNGQKIKNLDLTGSKVADDSSDALPIQEDNSQTENHAQTTLNDNQSLDDSNSEQLSSLYQALHTDAMTGEAVAPVSNRHTAFSQRTSHTKPPSRHAPDSSDGGKNDKPSSAKVKPEMRDVGVMTDMTFGIDIISELTPVYQSQIASLSSSKECNKNESSPPLCNGAPSRSKKSKPDHSRSVSPPHSRQDKCTSPLIPKLMLRNGVLNSCTLLNGYASPTVTALRENGKRVKSKRKLFLMSKRKQAAKSLKMVTKEQIVTTRQTSPMVCSAPEDDLVRLFDKPKTTTTFKSLSLKRLGSGKQGSHSFLISLPRAHYDNLPTKSSSDSSQTDEFHPKANGGGKSMARSPVQRRRTEIQLLLDGDKPRGQRVSANEIPKFIAEDVSSWSLNTPDKSSWLGSSTRKITPVDHFSFPLSSLSPKRSFSGSSLTSLPLSATTNRRKRAYSDDSDNASVDSPRHFPPQKQSKLSSPCDLSNGRQSCDSSPSPSSNSHKHTDTQQSSSDKPYDTLDLTSMRDCTTLSEAETSNSSNDLVHLQSDEVFCAELVVFDSRGECLLNDGEYAIIMQKCLEDKNSTPADLLTFEPLTWSSIFAGHTERNSAVKKSRNLLLKFSLSWSDGPPQHQLCSNMDTALDLKKIRETYYPPRPPTPAPTTCIAPEIPPPAGKRDSLTDPDISHNHRLSSSQDKSQPSFLSMEVDTSNLSLVPYSESSLDREKVFFNFLYGNNSLQQTECRENMQCPWCFLQCMRFYCLLKHMSLCHPRFHFTYSPSLERAKVIDVHVNKLYDTSSSIERDPGEKSSLSLIRKRQRPAKCFSCTCVLVERGVELEEDISEFLNDGSWRRGYNTNRMYYHTNSSLPMLDEEVRVDSEGEESLLEWQKICCQKMVDEFTDVNKGEKRLMKLWNLFVMENKLIAEKQIPVASVLFAKQKRETLFDEKIDKNFLSHLISLYDFGLITSTVIQQCMVALYETSQ